MEALARAPGFEGSSQPGAATGEEKGREASPQALHRALSFVEVTPQGKVLPAQGAGR